MSGLSDTQIGLVKEMVIAIERECDGPTCNYCGDDYDMEGGNDPTPLCHKCAQQLSGLVPAVLDELLSLQRALE